MTVLTQWLLASAQFIHTVCFWNFISVVILFQNDGSNVSIDESAQYGLFR